MIISLSWGVCPYSSALTHFGLLKSTSVILYHHYEKMLPHTHNLQTSLRIIPEVANLYLWLSFTERL